MIDFAQLPKQWLLGPGDALAGLGEIVHGKQAGFDGLTLVAAAEVPVITLERSGTPVGLLVGWPIHERSLYRDDAVVALAPEQNMDDVFAALGGRFVLVWRASDGRHLFREDSSGTLPAVFSPSAGLVGSTTTVVSAAVAHDVDEKAEGIFDFPNRRGFLPFGLTNREGIRRLLPNHVLDLSSFAASRVWPDPADGFPDRVPDGEKDGVLREVCDIGAAHMKAICAQEPAVLYLSGGYDSRLALAAARGHTRTLRLETFANGTADPAIARRVARAAGLPHRRIEIQPISNAERERWLWRAGRSIYDHVTEMAATVQANDPGTVAAVGAGAELLRHTYHTRDDDDTPMLPLGAFLKRFRLPDHPVVREAAAAWMASLPLCDTGRLVDVAKVELIQGSWAGAEVYGNPLPLPTLHTFSSQRYKELAVRLPTRYRVEGGAYRDVMRRLWPELLEIPANQPVGLERALFWRAEIRRLMPVRLKRFLKPLR